TATRKAFRRLWTTVAGLSGAEGEELVRFFAMGMLLNVSAALELDEVNQDWARLCSKLPPSWLDGPDAASPTP
ncbi:MAG: TetR/AcrR family transcriptional regulator, partial [Actinomycetes bacterium]